VAERALFHFPTAAISRSCLPGAERKPISAPAQRTRENSTQRCKECMYATSHTAAAGGMHNEKLLPLIKHRRCFLFLLSLLPKFENAALKSHRVLSLAALFNIHGADVERGSSKSCRAHGMDHPSNQPSQPVSRFAQLAGRNRSRCFALQTRPAGGACCCIQSTLSHSEKHTHTRQLLLKLQRAICLGTRMGVLQPALHFISWSCKIELGKIHKLQFSKFAFWAKKMLVYFYCLPKNNTAI